MSDNIVKDNQRIVHMHKALKCLNEQASGLAFEEMAFQNMRTAAILHYLTILGEAANRMSKEFCEEHPDIPWREIAGCYVNYLADWSHVPSGIGEIAALLSARFKDEVPRLVWGGIECAADG